MTAADRKATVPWLPPNPPCHTLFCNGRPRSALTSASLPAGSPSGPASKEQKGTLEGARKKHWLLLVCLLFWQQAFTQAASISSSVLKNKPATVGSNHQLLSVLPESTASHPLRAPGVAEAAPCLRPTRLTPLQTQGCWRLLPASTVCVTSTFLFFFLVLRWLFNQFLILKFLCNLTSVFSVFQTELKLLNLSLTMICRKSQMYRIRN